MIPAFSAMCLLTGRMYLDHISTDTPTGQCEGYFFPDFADTGIISGSALDLQCSSC